VTLSTCRTPSGAEARRIAEGPAGLGFAVVFCWALAAQLALQGFAGTVNRLGLHHGGGGLAGRLAAAVILVAVGEALRRGVEWARLATIALAVLFTVLAMADGLALLRGHGIPGFLVFNDLVCLTFIPWIAWRLSLRRTADWTASTRPRGAAPAVSWVVYAALLVLMLVTGVLGGITLPSGELLSLVPTWLIELTVVPLIAGGIGLRRAASTPAAQRPTPSPRTQGVWVPALVAWSVPWGIVVAVTQAVGVQ
jgi:hypothetical protein